MISSIEQASYCKVYTCLWLRNPLSTFWVIISLTHNSDQWEHRMVSLIQKGLSTIHFTFYSPNGHLKVLFYTFVNKTIYIFIKQVLSLPVALESVYKAPSVTLT